MLQIQFERELFSNLVMSNIIMHACKYCMCLFVGGCWRRQGQAGDDVASVAVDLTSTTTQQLSHRLECDPDEETYAGCLNGGRCFVIELHKSSRHVQCRSLS